MVAEWRFKVPSFSSPKPKSQALDLHPKPVEGLGFKGFRVWGCGASGLPGVRLRLRAFPVQGFRDWGAVPKQGLGSRPSLSPFRVGFRV